MHIILIVVDTLRADHLGCYGYFRDTSPNIDKLAAEGVRFSESHATAIATGPAFSSIITGLYPIHHGCYASKCKWNKKVLIFLRYDLYLKSDKLRRSKQ